MSQNALDLLKIIVAAIIGASGSWLGFYRNRKKLSIEARKMEAEIRQIEIGIPLSLAETVVKVTLSLKEAHEVIEQQSDRIAVLESTLAKLRKRH